LWFSQSGRYRCSSWNSTGDGSTQMPRQPAPSKLRVTELRPLFAPDSMKKPPQRGPWTAESTSWSSAFLSVRRCSSSASVQWRRDDSLKTAPRAAATTTSSRIAAAGQPIASNRLVAPVVEARDRGHHDFLTYTRRETFCDTPGNMP
jgi:hypothetical protein